MSNVFEESQLAFDFSKSLYSEKADAQLSDTLQRGRRGLKSVDFIVESKERFLFVEVKNLENPSVPDNEKKSWIEKLLLTGKDKSKSNIPFASEMAGKFKDTILFKWAQEISYDKPCEYIVILEFHMFQERERGQLAKQIMGHVPTKLHKDNGLKKEIQLENIRVIGVSQWNEDGFLCQYPITPI